VGAAGIPVAVLLVLSGDFSSMSSMTTLVVCNKSSAFYVSPAV
jgi:hypothetical protein